MRTLSTCFLAALSAAHFSVAWAQTSSVCDIFLTHPIVTIQTLNQSSSQIDNFRKLACSANWHNSSDAQKAGISADIPIYDFPVGFKGDWRQDQIDQWKSSRCSDEEKKGEYIQALNTTLYSIDPTSAKMAMDCIDSVTKHDAVRCNLTEASTGAMFQVFWRRTAGELPSAAPVIKSFAFQNAACLNASELKEGTQLSDGGTTVLCTRSDVSPFFVINTDRGQCFAMGSPVLPAVVLSGTIIMDRPFFYSGQKVVMASDLKIITNGYGLRVEADILEIQGSPEILSYGPSTPIPMAAGKSAGDILISAKRVNGGGLYILNAGTDGGPGMKGPTGGMGNPGPPGVGRTAKQDKVCDSPVGMILAPLVCKFVPAGCEGGKDGGVGGSGLPGVTGYAGAPGGRGGNVTLMLPPDAQKTEVVNVAIDTAADNSKTNCGGLICGGKGGKGGEGGVGGPGGAGGSGAPGTLWCGGTDAGQVGPTGPTGDVGQPGSSGPPGSVRRL